ncbi:MAG: D-2-hydroxyacid dehydrogenase [Limisphaerales bacterium]
MNIVVLDGFTLNPGDLSWDGLRSLGSCAIHDRTPAAEVVKRAADAEIVLTNKALVSREAIERLPKLRYIGVLATGYNIVDVETARARRIIVSNVPTYGTKSVAQMTFALLLELAQHAGHHAQTVREGRWTRGADFCYWDFPLVELDGLTMGIVGFGRIGREVATLARAFGMRVVAHSAHVPQPVPADVEFVELDALFQRSDVVSLHCPLTPKTKGLVNAARLALLKPSAFLINTSRGPLIDEPALAAALNADKLAGAGLDVLAIEPPVADNPLLSARNCLVTPHIAWATRAARSRLLDTAVDNVKKFLAGQPQNVVS